MLRSTLLLLFSSSLAYAQQTAPGIMVPALSADRPGLSDPADLLEVGMVQLETGFELDGAADNRVAILPQLLFRVGVLPRLEVRFSTDGYQASFTNDGQTRQVQKGFSDAALSAKVKVIESEAINFTLVPSLSIPTQDPNFSSGTFDPAIELVFGRGLPAGLDIGLNINGALPSDEQGRFFQGSGGVALGRGIVGELGAYLEIFGEFPAERGGENNLIFNGGLTQVLGTNSQIDLEGGVSLSTPDEFFLGFGFAARSLRWWP